MKNKKIIEVLGSVILIASLGITGCTVRAAEDTTEETEKERTEESEETEETEDPCGCVIDEEDCYNGCCVGSYVNYEFVSTNGELEGQLDYMELAPRCEDIDWSAYPDDTSISDISLIEDEELREIAQTYADQGFTVNDPEVDRTYISALGDGEYQFTDGFSATYDDERSYVNIYAYKMNETLFEYFMVNYYGGFDDSTVSDDGTVLRYGDDEYYAEFNRDTGIGVLYISCNLLVPAHEPAAEEA